jgi:hypothetical protein
MGSILAVRSSGLGSVKRSVKGFVNKKRKPIKRMKKAKTIYIGTKAQKRKAQKGRKR